MDITPGAVQVDVILRNMEYRMHNVISDYLMKHSEEVHRAIEGAFQQFNFENAVREQVKHHLQRAIGDAVAKSLECGEGATLLRRIVDEGLKAFGKVSEE